jgi:capsular polysaccharide biosynthesis protein
MTPMYKASATIYVNNTSGVSDKENVTSSDVSASIYLVRSYIVLAKSDQVLEKVADRLGDEYTVASLYNAISTSQIDNTIIFSVHVSHKDPYEAERIANHLAEVLTNDVGPKVILGSHSRIIDTARVPTSPYSPDYSSNILTGAAAGFLLALVYVTIQFLKDTRIKDENDLTDMFNLPILGRIPDFNDAVTGTRYAETETEGGEEA